MENLGDIPGVDPCFLTPDALTSLPVGAIIGAKPRKAETLADSLLKGSFTDGGATDLKETDKGGEIQREVSQLSVQDVEEGAGDVRRAMAVLKPPPDMMKSPQLHPLHIFVSIINACKRYSMYMYTYTLHIYTYIHCTM